MNQCQPLLKVEDLHTYYGNIHALRGVSLEVREGEIVTLIGSNGEGKSTTLNTLSGILRCREGRILLRGRPIHHLPAHGIVREGISQVPEGRKIFSRLTVAENLEMGAFLRGDPKAIRSDMGKVFSLFPKLEERKQQVAGTLSGGEQQMLAMGRALMARPAVLLLDEPSMGLAPLLVREIFRVIQRINQQGAAILLVEQNAHLALEVAHRAYILETGEIALQGPASELRHHPQVLAAYLGGA